MGVVYGYIFRDIGRPSAWPSIYPVANIDILTAEISIVFAAFLLLLFTLLPSFPLNKRTFVSYAAAIASLYVGWACLFAGVFGYDWVTGSVETRTYLAAGTDVEINARIGLHVGTYGFNVTLLGLPREQNGFYIDYNEYFSWEWAQGRYGFSKYAGRINRDFRRSEHYGVPEPILRVAEYFTLDGEWIRWGRHYREAGYFSFLILRASFVIWILVNFIYFVQAQAVASFLSAFLGVLILSACAVYGIQQSAPFPNLNPLMIPFRDGILTPRLGAHFYIVLVAGITCLVMSLLTHPSGLLKNGVLKDLFADNLVVAELEEEAVSKDSSKPGKRFSRNIVKRKSHGPDDSMENLMSSKSMSAMDKKSEMENSNQDLKVERSNTSSTVTSIPSSPLPVYPNNDEESKGIEMSQFGSGDTDSTLASTRPLSSVSMSGASSLNSSQPNNESSNKLTVNTRTSRPLPSPPGETGGMTASPIKSNEDSLL